MATTTATPAKVQSWLDRAAEFGLTVEHRSYSGQSPDVSSWVISSPNPIDETQLWLYWSPGTKGGRLTIIHYRGHLTAGRRKSTVRASRLEASWHLTDMRDSLSRHQEREARKQDTQPAPRQPDPARPGWFMVDQGITVPASERTRVHYRVASITYTKSGRVQAVAVSTNGGYGPSWTWFGDHDQAQGDLNHLENPDVGMPDTDRRAWPRHLATAKQAINLVLRDQCLSGWANTSTVFDGILVTLPRGVDPYRHLVLLRRYQPYLGVEVRELRQPATMPLILIKPKGT